MIFFNRQRIFCHYCGGGVVVVINAGSSSSCGGIGGIGSDTASARC